MFSLVSCTYGGPQAEASLPAFEACIPHGKQLRGHLSLLGSPMQKHCMFLCSIKDLGSVLGSGSGSLVRLRQHRPDGSSDNHSGGCPWTCGAFRWQGPAQCWHYGLRSQHGWWQQHGWAVLGTFVSVNSFLNRKKIYYKIVFYELLM